MVERYVDIVEVTSSILSRPPQSLIIGIFLFKTIFFKRIIRNGCYRKKIFENLNYYTGNLRHQPNKDF